MGTLTLESPTAIDLPATIRELRALESVAASMVGRCHRASRRSEPTAMNSRSLWTSRSTRASSSRRKEPSDVPLAHQHHRCHRHVAVLALGIVLVAVPLGLPGARRRRGRRRPSLGTNALYQAQVDGLREEEERLDEIEASVAGLQTQITPANELDDVFELVASAAQATGVTITSITAGDPVPFVERTSATAIGEVVEAPAAAPRRRRRDDADATADAAATDATTPAADAAAVPTGRTQVDFTIAVTADELDQVVAFLDALRGGSAPARPDPDDRHADRHGLRRVRVTALTFVLPQEG